MRVPTKKPPIGKGLCYQGDKADKTLPCLTKGTEKPIDAVWGPWIFKDEYVGEGSTIAVITPKHSKWTFPKINTVKVGATLVGIQVPGSGIIKWPNGGIDAAVKVVKDLGHTLGKTVHYVQKANNTIYMYKKGNASGKTGADTWEFQKGEEQNPNFGREGEHCISEQGLVEYPKPENQPGKRYYREIKTRSDYDGTPATQIDGGKNTKVIPYMRKDGINVIKGGKPLNNMSEVECKQWVKDTPESFEAKEGLGGTWGHIPPGCVTRDDGKTHYNRTASNKECSSGGYHCVEKGPGGPGYIKYCPVDASFSPKTFKSGVGNQDRCYLSNDPDSRSKYTEKELEDEAKRRFVRDNELPRYEGERHKESRIVGPGSRTIYRFKEREELLDDEQQISFVKHGGLTPGLWHEKKESFGDVSDYDYRTKEYDECEDVGKVLEKIRKGNESGQKNYGEWKSSRIVRQVPCEPVYEWDGKIYKDKESAKAGSTSEKIMKPAQDGTSTNGKATKVQPSEKDPGEYLHKTGNFLMSSVYSTGKWSTPSLNGRYGWLARSDRRTSPGWVRMETVSGDIELVKGVVTKGYDENHRTSKFKVYVSRNGDSWKQMKDRSGNYEFSGGTDKNTNYLKTNYFKDGPVEARYIKFYPTAGGKWRSLNAGYVQDESGVIKCIGGSGMLKDEPWFRFTFNEAKTKTKGTMSEGAARGQKCPPDGHVFVAQRGKIVSGPNNIPVNKLKLLKGDGKVDGLEGVMTKVKIHECGVDPSIPGWRSSSSGGSFSWSACKKPNNQGLLGTEDAYHKEDKGYRYMYRHLNPGDNNGYTINTDNTPFKDNTQSSNADNGSTYTMPSTSFKVQDYENFNVIRQPCNRGTKGTVPTPGKEIWKSTTPYVDGMAVTSGASGYMGEIRNLSGGVEGWIDIPTKYKWSNDFNNKIREYTAGDTVLNDYGVYEVGGTNANSDSNSWGANFRGSRARIDGDRMWHSPKPGGWSTLTTNDKWTARYEDSNKFIPIGIRIQPYGGYSWEAYSPTVIRFRLYTNEDSVWSPNIVLGPFSKNQVKTILIHPEDRKKLMDKNGNGICVRFYVYSRHGYNVNHVSFRINFILAKKGTGKKSVEKSWSANSDPRPVDCSTSLTAYKETRDNPGWRSHNQCWMGGKGCGSAEADKSSWKSRTVTITKTRDRVVNRPNYGGKNDCTAATGLNRSTRTVYEEKDKSPCGINNCDGKRCGHCPGTPTCAERWKCEWTIIPGGWHWV